MEEGHASAAAPASPATFNVEQSPEDAGKPAAAAPTAVTIWASLQLHSCLIMGLTDVLRGPISQVW